MKSTLPHIGALALFFLLVLIYFHPVFEGKVLQQGDITHFAGMSRELVEYGKPSGWTGSMFSGMPSYQITGYSTGIDLVGWVKGSILGAIHSETAGPILMLLITAYILFLIIGTPWWLAVLGAIATAFSSYNLIITVAGHVTKAWTLSFVPLVLSGLLLVFKKSYWPGFLVFAFGLSLLIVSNHLQITYYTALFCLILFIGFFVDCLLKKEYKHTGITSGILAAGVLIAVLANINNLYLNYESGQESMRGKSELTPLADEQSDAPASSGLDKDYVFDWSYGKGEILSLLVPNVMGGASGGTLGKDSHLYKELKAHGAQPGNQFQTYTYWGDKMFTSGPVYFGAVICFLFLLSFFIVRKKSKWWLLGAAVFFIVLAWGRNLAWFNDFMFYHFPYYSKFRTVEMALVIPAFIFPILAVMALNDLIAGKMEKQKSKKALFWSAGITSAICLILWIMPGTFFHFESAYDAQFTNQVPDWYYAALIDDRKALLQADALRSWLFILLAAVLIFVYIQAKNQKKILPYFAVGLILLVACDLWMVDKRYLNEDHFLPKRTYNEQLFPKSVADQAILEDKSLSYRVLNLRNPFQDAGTSYYHKSIGGYHAAKLGRYQDLINRRLSKELSAIVARFTPNATLDSIIDVFHSTPTLNMLNAKYLIFSPEQPPIVNPRIFGNAWFVNSYRFVETPDEEMAALDTLDPKTEAVFDKQFEGTIGNLQIIPDENASIQLTAYFPNRVEYTSSSSQKGLAVFSEVYYKNGWKATIDGQAAPISRADYILRAIVIPEGEHNIQFVFDPDDIRVCGIITTLFSALLMLLVMGGLGFYTYRKLSAHD
jgi:hypothetical protein